MKTLIVYTTKYESTKKCVERLQKQLSGEVSIIQAGEKKPFPEVEAFDTVILGGAVYIGRFPKALQEFIHQNKTVLLQKRLGLFFVGATPLERAQEIWQLFSAELLDHASVKMGFGGEIDWSKLKFFDRQIMKLVQKSEGFQMPVLSYTAVEEFAKQIQA